MVWSGFVVRAGAETFTVVTGEGSGGQMATDRYIPPVVVSQSTLQRMVYRVVGLLPLWHHQYCHCVT